MRVELKLMLVALLLPAMFAGSTDVARAKEKQNAGGYYESFTAKDANAREQKRAKSEDGYYANIPPTAPVKVENDGPSPVSGGDAGAAPMKEVAPPVVPTQTPPPAVEPTAAPARTAPPVVAPASNAISVNKPAVAPTVKMPNPTLTSAMAVFNDRRFGPALAQFEYLDKHGQCNERTHYYIARCCQQLSQVDRAQRNYAWILAYGKDPQLRAYAQVGYQQLTRYSQRRTYEGNGNFFQPFRGGGGGGGGGG